jgi:hypothetical protein
MTDQLNIPGIPFTSTPDDQIMPAWASCLRRVTTITKDQVADTGKYTYGYASLGAVLNAIKTTIADEGLVLSQNVTTEENLVYVSTTLYHVESAQWITWMPLGLKAGSDPQATGSAITYGRRYALLTLFGIATEDDDGHAATAEARNPEQRTEAEKEMRAMIAGFGKQQRHAFIEAFKDEFGMGLTDLPMSRHGDALTWAKAWKYHPTPADDTGVGSDPATEGAQ